MTRALPYVLAGLGLGVIAESLYVLTALRIERLTPASDDLAAHVISHGLHGVAAGMVLASVAAALSALKGSRS